VAAAPAERLAGQAATAAARPGESELHAAERVGARSQGPLPALARRLQGRGLWPATLLLAALLCFITFYAKGGLSLEPMSFAEIVLTLLAGLIVAGAALRAPGGRIYGLGSTGLLLAFTMLTAISVVWSVAPDASWQDTGRMLAYSGVFAASVALVRLAPDRWPAVLGGLTLAAVVVCAYALLTKIFPATLAPSVTYARLEEPYGYWNAIGLTAAMGAIGCIWLGARRQGHGLLSALAYPALGVMLLTLLLSYSRGAVAALVVGVVLWFAIVPLRLRGACVLILAGAGATAVAAWDFSSSALSSENVPLAERTTAGHELGALVLAMMLALVIAGVAIGFHTSRRAPSALLRRRAGTALLALIVIAVIAFLGALAHSHRGLTGSISHAVSALTNPNARTPPNTPGRLTAVASVRARYWKEALQVFDAHPLLGAGALGYRTARLRYRTETLDVAHAHSFLFQTLSDFGIVGLLLALALLLAWATAAARATRPSQRGSPTAERVGLTSMLCLVVVFGAHSLVDWTWYVPGNACVALICAGWLAGRGPLPGLHRIDPLAAAPRDADGPPVAVGGPLAPRADTRRAGLLDRVGRVRASLAALAIIAALLAAWSQWQPQRAEEAREQALEQLASHPARALATAHDAVSLDPLSPLAKFTLASVQQYTGHTALARATLQQAVREQPSDPQTWLELARDEMTNGEPRAALPALQASIYLNPQAIAPELLAENEREAIEIHNDYIEALQAAAAPATVKSASAPR